MKYVPAKNFTKSNRTTIDLVVVHTAECSETAAAAENLQSWTAGPNASVASWHYAVDSDSVTQSVLEKDIAWHAGPVNGFSIGIEHAGYAKQTAAEWADAYSTAMLERSAALVADICTRYGIPVRRLTAEDLARGERRGICGHVDVTRGLKSGTHWDPGPSFPFDAYLARVAHYAGEIPKPETQIDNAEPVHIELAPGEGDMVEVECNGVTWLVAPHYIAPVGIGQAVELAAANGCELPSPELVDAIWKAADLRLAPLPQRHDGSIKGMATAYAAQEERIRAQIAGRSYRLLAGTHKDVCIRGGKVGLYGWTCPDGRVIQPFYAGHALSWKDGSQGLRLVRRRH